jgi:hypothetical protein
VIQVAKKLVRGDYKSNRVKDPTAKLSSHHAKSIKNYVKEFMDKAVKKKEDRDRKKAALPSVETDGKGERSTTPPGEPEEAEWDDNLMDITNSPTDSLSDLKRKRDGDEEPSSPKKSRLSTDELQQAPPPPPPPPPPGIDVDGEGGLTPIDDDASLNGNGKAVLRTRQHPIQVATPSTNGNDTRHPDRRY